MTTGTTTGVGTVQTSSSGTTYLTGTASGLNTQALIQNAVNAKLIPANRLDAQVSTNTNKIVAFQTLQTQANALKTAIDTLKSDTLLGNVFTAKQVSGATSDGSNASDILSATTSFGAQSGTYNVVVGQLATPESVSSDVQTTATAAMGYTGTFDIGEPGKTATTINVTAGMTLQQLRNAINVTTTTSGVAADILQLSSGQFQLILSAADTNKNVTVSNVTGTDVLHSLGVTNAGGAFQHITQPAQPATLTINTTPITSDTNVISNVLTGLTFNLANSAPTTTVTIKVGDNVSGVETAISNVVSAYNTLHQTIAANQKINGDGTVDANATLFDESINKSLGNQLSAALTTSYGSSSVFNGLGSLGITLDSDNNLVTDNVALDTALQNNFSDVQSVFATNGASIGLADTVSTLIDSYSNVVTGSITNSIADLQSTDVTLTNQSNAIKSATDDYQAQLIQTYANLEASMKSAATLKLQILAILNGSTPNSNNG